VAGEGTEAKKRKARTTTHKESGFFTCSSGFHSLCNVTMTAPVILAGAVGVSQGETEDSGQVRTHMHTHAVRTHTCTHMHTYLLMEHTYLPWEQAYEF
jgi:hypothetical protein